jgi:hypothetical protein
MRKDHRIIESQGMLNSREVHNFFVISVARMEYCPDLHRYKEGEMINN